MVGVREIYRCRKKVDGELAQRNTKRPVNLRMYSRVALPTTGCATPVLLLQSTCLYRGLLLARGQGSAVKWFTACDKFRTQCRHMVPFVLLFTTTPKARGPNTEVDARCCQWHESNARDPPRSMVPLLRTGNIIYSLGGH